MGRTCVLPERSQGELVTISVVEGLAIRSAWWSLIRTSVIFGNENAKQSETETDTAA